VSGLKPPVGPADHRLGPDSAPVKLVEFGDLECPHCRRAQPIVHEVRRRLGSKLQFVFRHFPLATIHPHAERAAEAAEAAASQGKFWEMEDAIFARQEALEDEDLVARALALGLDVEAFVRDLASGVHLERIRGDFRSGVRSGVNGTPTFFINGVRHDASWDLETLLEALAAAT